MNSDVPSNIHGKGPQDVSNSTTNPTEMQVMGTGVITEQPMDKFSMLGPPPPYTEFPQNGFDPVLLAEGNGQVVNNIQVDPADSSEECERKRRERDRCEDCDDCFCCCCYEPGGLPYGNAGIAPRHNSWRCCEGNAGSCDCGICNCGDCNCGDCDCGDCGCGDFGACDFGACDFGACDLGGCNFDCNIS